MDTARPQPMMQRWHVVRHELLPELQAKVRPLAPKREKVIHTLEQETPPAARRSASDREGVTDQARTRTEHGGCSCALPAGAIAERLAAASATSQHVFWPDAVSLLDGGRVAWDAVLGSRQVSDVYLLALAVQQDGRLVTLDRRIPLQAVPEAGARHLVVI